MKKNVTLTFIFLVVFILNFISAAPPVTTVDNFPQGYLITESQHQYLKINEDYQYNFFVYNASDGVLIDNSTMTCTFFLANSSGEVLFSNEVTYFSDGHWGIDILGGNFSSISSYPYGVNCQDGYGGALAGVFETTPTGMAGDDKAGLLIAPMGGLILMFLISLVVKKWKLKAFLHLMSLGFLILLINMSGLLFVNSEQLYSLWTVTLTASIVIFLVWLLYISIYYTIEVVNQIKQKKQKQWNPY